MVLAQIQIAETRYKSDGRYSKLMCKDDRFSKLLNFWKRRAIYIYTSNLRVSPTSCKYAYADNMYLFSTSLELFVYPTTKWPEWSDETFVSSWHRREQLFVSRDQSFRSFQKLNQGTRVWSKVNISESKYKHLIWISYLYCVIFSYYRVYLFPLQQPSVIYSVIVSSSHPVGEPLISLCFLDHVFTPHTVSYTHLDVYKRQALYSRPCDAEELGESVQTFPLIS